MNEPVSRSAALLASSRAFSRIKRVLIIDDHSILREGLRRLLSMEPDLEVGGEAATLARGLELAALSQPDIILMDITFPVGCGLSVIERLRQIAPDSRVVVLSVQTQVQFVETALRMGAHAYVRKDAGLQDLLLAMRDGAPPSREGRGRCPALTRRELQILVAVARGMTNKQIAAQVSRSVKTIDKHRASMMRKLGLDDAGAVTRYALAKGYLSLYEGEH